MSETKCKITILLILWAIICFSAFTVPAKDNKPETNYEIIKIIKPNPVFAEPSELYFVCFWGEGMAGGAKDCHKL